MFTKTLTTVLPLSLALLMVAAVVHSEQMQWPKHIISLSFDTNQAVAYGTSKIIIPVSTPIDLSFGPLEVTGAVLEEENETPKPVVLGENTLKIPSRSKTQTLFVSWQLQASKSAMDNLISDKGITLAGFWHPISSADMHFSVEALLPEGFSAITEAEQITVTGTNQESRIQASFPHPLRAVHFIAGPYVVQSKQVSNLTLYSYFFHEDASLAQGYLDKAADYIERYENLIGPFPYKRYSIVENRLPTGYGMPTFTLLGQAVVRLPFIKDTSLGHEILHSWFGNSVFLDDGSNWCEGLTTYLADHLYAKERNQGVEYRKNQLQRYHAYVHDQHRIPLAQFYNAGDSQPLARQIRAVGYDKASMIFHMLQKRIGEPAFTRGLQLFYSNHRFKRAGWTDLIKAFTETSGQDLGVFFSQWLKRDDIPHLTVENIKVNQENGRSKVTFDLVQLNEQAYSLDVPLRLTTVTDDVQETVHIDQNRQTVVLYADTLPISLTLDPQYDLMRVLLPDERSPTWSWFLGAESRKVLLPDDSQVARYQPLIDLLRKSGCTLVAAKEANSNDLATGSWLMLGDSALRRSLFASPRLVDKEFVLDVRKNPLDQQQVIVLVDSSAVGETASTVHRLRHYGKYSFLHFRGGRITAKEIKPAAKGINLPLVVKPQGTPVAATMNFDDIVDDLAKSRVIFVGETHTDYGAHLLQLQIIQALAARTPNLAIGMEMFPRSSQPALDDYINGKINSEREFIKASNYLNVWGYNYRLYQGIIGFAKNNNIPLVGLNLDKTIVRQVFRTGSTDDISAAQHSTIAADRDLDVPGYRERLEPIHGQHGSSPHGSGFGGFLQSQALWDETMAESAALFLKANHEHLLVVIAGSGHVYKDSAIPLRLARRLPGIRQSVIVTASSGEPHTERGQKVDYLMYAPQLELEEPGKIGVILKEEPETGAAEHLRVIQISPHGKAGAAGLAEEDIITAVDGEQVATIIDLRLNLMDKTVGEMVNLTILRGDEQLEIPVELSGLQGRPSPMAKHPPIKK